MQSFWTQEVMIKKDVKPVAVLMQQLELLYSAWKMVMYHPGTPQILSTFHSEGQWMYNQILLVLKTLLNDGVEGEYLLSTRLTIS